MTTSDDTPYEVRTARPEDREAIAAMDGSVTTRTVFRVAVTENGFALREVTVDPPLHKVFPDGYTDEGEDMDEVGDTDEGDDHAWEDVNSRTFVAVGTDGRPAGFAAVSYAPWNRRLTIEDIEVAPAHRGRGIARALMGRAAEFGRERGAGHLWLEVTNVNAPAIHAYRRLGFAFCGLDTALYDGTHSAGEQALYMSRPCP